MCISFYRKCGIIFITCCSFILLSACSLADKESDEDTIGMSSETKTQITETTSWTVESATEEETTVVSKHTENAAQDDYIFPNSDKEYITLEEADSKTNEELRIGRNEIYARHGRKFSDEKLQTYFDSKDWYHGTVVPEEFDESVLSLEERNNVKDLSNLEWQREALNSGQSYRYVYDISAYPYVDGEMLRRKESQLEGEYFIVTPIDFDHLNVEAHTFWGDRTFEFSRVGFGFEGVLNYNNECAGDFKDGHMGLGKNEASILIDGNDGMDYYTR